jgi:hypothetical protein
MSAAQHLALTQFEFVRKLWKLAQTTKWPLVGDNEITFLKHNLSNFERRGNLIIVIYSPTVQ